MNFERILTMTISGIFTPTNILTAWLIHVIIAEMIKGKTMKIDHYRDSLRIALATIGIVLTIMILADLGIAYLGGYIHEKITYLSKTIGSLFVMYAGFEILTPIIASISVFRKVRNNKSIYLFQIIFIGLYLIINLLSFGVRSSQFATSTIPGFHTTIISIGSSLGVFICFITIFSINSLIVIYREKSSTAHNTA